MTMIEIFAIARVLLYFIVAGYSLFTGHLGVAFTMLMVAGIALDGAFGLPPEAGFLFTNIGGSLVAYYLFKYVKGWRN